MKKLQRRHCVAVLQAAHGGLTTCSGSRDAACSLAQCAKTGFREWGRAGHALQEAHTSGSCCSGVSACSLAKCARTGFREGGRAGRALQEPHLGVVLQRHERLVVRQRDALRQRGRLQALRVAALPHDILLPGSCLRGLRGAAEACGGGSGVVLGFCRAAQGAILPTSAHAGWVAAQCTLFPRRLLCCSWRCAKPAW